MGEDVPYLISPPVHERIGWLLVAAIVVLSLAPTGPLPQVTAGYDDKIVHGLIYSVVMTWFAVIMVRLTWISLALRLFALGAGLEGCQALLPYRTASIADMVANACGILLRAFVAFALTTGSNHHGRAK